MSEELRECARKVALDISTSPLTKGSCVSEFAIDCIAAAIKQAECRAQNNQVACVSCHQPVQVTALNAIRCDDCGPTPLQERVIKQAEARGEARGLREAAAIVCVRCRDGYPFQKNGGWHNDMNGKDTLINNMCEAAYILQLAQERER